MATRGVTPPIIPKVTTERETAMTMTFRSRAELLRSVKKAHETPAPGVITKSIQRSGGDGLSEWVEVPIGPSLWDQTVIQFAQQHTVKGDPPITDLAKAQARAVLEPLGYECPEE